MKDCPHFCRWTRISFLCVALLLTLLVAACGGSEEAENTPGAEQNLSGNAGGSELSLVDRTAVSGLDFTHDHGGKGRYFYAEIMNGGGALLDFDNDGDLDVYAVQGQELPEVTSQPPILRDRLFRNEGVQEADDGVPTPVFTDVTEELGLDITGYGFGAATGDFDNDGWTDLYVTQLGANILLRNVGGERFEDVTATAGVAGDGMSTSAAFVDLDRDGFLDLFVTNYLRYTLATDKKCTDMVGVPEYCGPQSYDPARDRLYRNRGDGTFEDVTTAAGINRDGAGLGVVTGDFDGDGWMDFYVANDQAPNHLWMNQGANGGVFQLFEEAMYRGSALDRNGKAEASMGVEVADLDHDGDEDLFMTHLIGETNTLYLNDGAGQFEDVSLGTTLGSQSLRWTGFGCAFFDLDRDGWLDLYVANGAVRADPQQRAAGHPFPYQEPNLLFHNNGEGDFTNISDVVQFDGEDRVSRGVVPGDMDNDGDMDLVVFNTHGPMRLLLNTSETANHWLGLRLTGLQDGDPPGRDMLGARVEVGLSNGQRLVRRVRTATSYMSARDPRVLVGLGTAAEPVDVLVDWPDGTQERWPELAVDAYHELVQGRGETDP